MTSSTLQAQQLKGGFKELLLLFLPIGLMSFSSCLYMLVEKLLLAQLSIHSMEAAVNAAYASQIFLSPCVVLSMMAQVLVGRCYGANDWKSIGPGIWQFIWFSLFSMIITVPVSIVYGNLYFEHTVIEEIVFPYYYFLSFMNFLFPLGTTLSCFYVGQGKTRLVLWSTLGSQVLKLLLTYVFIFGYGWIPAIGLLGGVLSTFVAQSAFCLTLLISFLKSSCHSQFNTRSWHFKPKLFWDCIRPGLSRAFSRIFTISSWASIARLMSSGSETHILLLSIGGTLFLFLPFLGDAICQAQTTVLSQILGARDYQFLGRSLYSCFSLVSISILLLGIPLILFPIETFQYIFPTIVLDATITKKVFWGVWLCFTFFTISYVYASYIFAFKDAKFISFMGPLSWINGYLWMWFAMEIFKFQADSFWLALSLMHASNAFIYFMRVKVLKSRVLDQSMTSSYSILPQRDF